MSQSCFFIRHGKKKSCRENVIVCMVFMKLCYRKSAFTYIVTIDDSENFFLRLQLVWICFVFRNMANCKRRKCNNSPNVFCFICGYCTLPKQLTKVIYLVKKAYIIYFGIKLNCQNKTWVPPYNMLNVLKHWNSFVLWEN